MGLLRRIGWVKVMTWKTWGFYNHVVTESGEDMPPEVVEAQKRFNTLAYDQRPEGAGKVVSVLKYSLPKGMGK